MAYQIRYSLNGQKKRKIKYIKISPYLILAVSAWILLCCCHVALNCDFSQTLRMLFPWTDQQTQEAFSVMEESLSQGNTIKDTLDSFLKTFTLTQ